MLSVLLASALQAEKYEEIPWDDKKWEGAFASEWDYAFGLYTGREYGAAYNLFWKLAKQGNHDAQYMIAISHYNGVSVEGVSIEQDFNEAVNWANRSAEQGNKEAQTLLSQMYFKGEGIAQDYIKAYAWAEASILGGDERAKLVLDEIARSMTFDQVAEARASAKRLIMRLEGEDSYSGSNSVDILRMASRSGNIALLEDVIAKGADVNAKTSTGDTILIETLKSRSSQLRLHRNPNFAASRDLKIGEELSNMILEAARRLIAYGADVNAKGKDSAAPLLLVSIYGDPGAVKLLIESGADVNVVDRDGHTPLTYAVSRPAWVETARLLIQSGADVNVKGISELLASAKFVGGDNMVALLQEAGVRWPREGGQVEFKIAEYYREKGDTSKAVQGLIVFH